jgi:hypothetical protein
MIGLSCLRSNRLNQIKGKRMDDNTLVDSSFSATSNAPIEKIDIPTWCFSLPEAEYQACSPAHCSAGMTTAPDGRRMSINVEVLGGSPMVQHCVEEISDSTSTPELLDSLAKQGIPWEVFKAARKPISEAHNRQETPLFARSIERYALSNSYSAGVANAATVV